MRITSPTFEDGADIPQKYGKDFANVNPPLEIHDAPPETKSFVIIMEDPDVPPEVGVPVWDHWIVFNIPSTVTHIPEAWEVQGVRGSGTRGMREYSGPRPPDQVHRYFFQVYAVGDVISLPEGATKQQVLDEISGKVLDSAELMGRFAPPLQGR